ncbi:MAG: MipA/OmpV family protein [Rubrivivax sp.]|nr:MipA/OmpV family protein [Rubrivivax sp.]
MTRRLGWLPTLALAAAAAPTLADQPLWELGLGAGALSLPHYRGSDQRHSWLLPVPYAVYRGKIFRATREGARAVLLESERFDFDLSVDASAPARSGDNVARAGMPDLEPTVEFGPSLNLTLGRGSGWRLDLRLPVRAVFTLGSDARGIGVTANPVLNLDLQLQGWNLGLQGGPLFASRAHHAHFYSVPPAYANADRPAYGAPGGTAGWRFTVGASRRFGDLWAGAFLRTDSLAGAVFEASPLVRQRDNVAFGLALSWVFARSDARVADDR